MKVYVISVETLKTGFKAISWQGYKTIDAARAFILSRGDKPQSFEGWYYQSVDYAYRIHEISID